MSVSVVILTFNRPEELRATVSQLASVADNGTEVIVVDNASEVPAEQSVSEFSFVKTIRLDENLGVAGRNAGLLEANGDIIVCLDDDVRGLSVADTSLLEEIFDRDSDIAAVCFKVCDEQTGLVTNWVHHRNQEIYSDKEFETYEITEGAVAFRRTALLQTRLYPESFFISHEGPDLALQLMDKGQEIRYTPEVIVRHSHSETSRQSWRNYYYDARNAFYLAARNYPWHTAIGYVAEQASIVFLYAARDGYLRWWFKAIFDGLRGIRREARNRVVISKRTRERLKKLKRYEESLWPRLVRFLKGQRIGQQ